MARCPDCGVPEKLCGCDERIDAAELLDDVVQHLRRFVVLPDHYAYDAVALWAAHAHAMEAWDSTPRLAFMGPEKQCGKSRAQEVTETLVPHPLRTSTVTSAVLFRQLGENPPPTVFMDEVDTIWVGKGVNEELRAVINAGHRRGNSAHRMVGEGSGMKATEFSTFGALSLAGIGDLPDTIADRSVIVSMRRKLPSETVERFRFREHNPEGHELRARLADWVLLVGDRLKDARPEIPDEIDGRVADCWEPLLAVADVAGSDWPQRARGACLSMSAGIDDRVSTGVRLLTDIREAWNGSSHMATHDLLDALYLLDESPWGDDPRLTARRLAYLVGRYGIKTQRSADWRGYHRSDFDEVWARYCPPSPRNRHEPSDPSSETVPMTLVTGHDGSPEGVRPQASQPSSVLHTIKERLNR